ncbi:MAG: WD40/YVTN/BNR-like repeat-containing protein, partial [Gemmatimonadales bacterium]
MFSSPVVRPLPLPVWLSRLALLTLPLIGAGSVWAPVEPSLLAGLKWRNIGPFRAGRVSAVAGAIGQPGVYYMGLPIGGVWKTTSAGVTWVPIFDDIKDVSSIGSVEVAPSNPDIVYVGTGGVNEGDGVYKSTDAGTTWQHLGMEQTRAIPLMLVDPKNPDVVLMAALGSARVADGNRGVFRTTDGGRNWTRTLFVDSTTGAENLAWAFDRPDVMLATTIRRGGRRGRGAAAQSPAPSAQGSAGAAAAGGGRGRGGRGGGAGNAQGAGPGALGSGTGLYKSTDEGITWNEISGNGLPDLTGRVSVAVAMHTNAQRMFLIGTFGLYRSDDGGGSWHRMAANDVRIINGQGGYTSGVWVNTGNPDIVYTIATAAYMSTDGGRTFTAWKGAPGGDDPQVMWFDPTDPKRMFMGLDQGGTVSQDGGDTWSLWYNQPTAQIYHISADNSWPYWIYGTQQDACAIAVRPRGDLGEITMLDWTPNPGNERGPIVPDPLNPKIVYATNLTAGIMKMTLSSGQWMNVSPNVDTSLGLRWNNENPLVFNGTNPHELFAGFQYVMSTTDGGGHWRKISPDLGVARGAQRPAPRAQGPAPRAQGPSVGGTINAMSSSPVAPGVLWVGMNNGLIWVTRDHGATWADVSIPDVRGPISSLDASHLDAATMYVALRAAGESGPSFYRTHNFGKTWTKIVNGMRADQVTGSYAHVIRADPKKAGLLYAGTESSMYVSVDDGDDWQSLMLNLPNTSYRDIVVKDNDLIVATYGRGIWILDDISPLRQITPAIAAEPAHLFKPGDAIRVRREMNEDTPFPPEVPHALNPPVGAIIYYYLGARPAGDITLEILDAAGHIVRHYSSAPIPADTNPAPQTPPYWLKVPEPLPTAIGTNRINWDIRYDDPPA